MAKQLAQTEERVADVTTRAEASERANAKLSAQLEASEQKVEDMAKQLAQTEERVADVTTRAEASERA
ncbi:hypothetical protein ACXWOF_10450, partial [Streptococcus pyogenes]